MLFAIQLAQYRLTGKCVGTYESCSTAAFKHGRTETVRPCTTATHTVCKQLLERSSNATVQDIQNSIKQCSEVHNQLTKDAAMGKVPMGLESLSDRVRQFELERAG